jgi:hypothetical protein
MLFSKVLARITAGGGAVLGWLKKLWPLLGRMARVLAPWLAWTLILDDIMVFLQGGDSALGRLLDTMFGVGTANGVLIELRDAWSSIREKIQSVTDTVKEWLSQLDPDTKQAIALLVTLGIIGSTGIGKITISLVGMIAKLIVATVQWGIHAVALGVANVAANGFWLTLLNIGIAIGAAAMAVGALYLAWDQFQKLLGEAGGVTALLKGLGTLIKGKGLFAGVDAAANDKARADAARREAVSPGVPSIIGQDGVPPMLRAPVGGPGSVATLNDNRTVTVNVSAHDKPAAVGHAVAGAVRGAQASGPNLKALHGALAGAPHG